jgi:hypothetical protein
LKIVIYLRWRDCGQHHTNNYITTNDSEDEEMEMEMDGRDDDVVEIVVHMVD